MVTLLLIATFNLENFNDDYASGSDPELAEQIEILRPQLKRLRADVQSLQEVHGQERDGEPRQLRALSELLSDIQ